MSGSLCSSLCGRTNHFFYFCASKNGFQKNRSEVEKTGIRVEKAEILMKSVVCEGRNEKAEI